MYLSSDKRSRLGLVQHSVRDGVTVVIQLRSRIEGQTNAFAYQAHQDPAPALSVRDGKLDR